MRLLFCVTFFAVLILTVPDAHAQGSRLESFFDDAQRFINKQGQALEREFRDPSSATRSGSEPPRPRVDIGPVPMPLRKPHSKPEPDTAAGDTREPITPVTAAPAPPAAADQQISQAPVSPEATPVIPLPARNPILVGTRDQPPPEAAPHPREIEIPDWTEEQIRQAKADCDAVLDGLTVEFKPLESIREGQCGAPYPIRLLSIGSPAVAIDPPARLTCAMAAALNQWLGDIVQPAAREMLGGPVVQLRNAASYVCRTRYNAPDRRISEHALANALDLSAFSTQTGESVSLIRHWRREVPASADKPADATAAQPAKAPDAKTGDEKSARADPKKTETAPPEKTAAVQSADTDSATPGKDDPKDRFLRTVHTGACGIFGTVLGPQANESHHDHFHLDMKQRRNSAYCE